MSQAGKAAMEAFATLGILAAVGAVFVYDDLDLSLGLGASAAALLAVAGLIALGDHMPPLPPLVLPPRSLWQSRIRQAMAGDGLARMMILEQLDRIQGPELHAGGRLLQDDRRRILDLSRSEFAQFLREQMDAADR